MKQITIPALIALSLFSTGVFAKSISLKCDVPGQNDTIFVIANPETNDVSVQSLKWNSGRANNVAFGPKLVTWDFPRSSGGGYDSYTLNRESLVLGIDMNMMFKGKEAILYFQCKRQEPSNNQF